jgi:nucleoid-associated protein EbfC
MLGKFGDMMGKLKEAKKIADEVKEKLEQTNLTVDAAGGDIRITISGTRKVSSISVAPSLQHGDTKELESQLLKAMNQAIEKADKVNEEEMKRVAGGIMPGMF